MPQPTHLTAKEQEKFSVLNTLIKGEITNAQATTMLRLSLRQVKRLKKKMKEKGINAVIHQLKGRGGNNHIDLSIKEKALNLVKEKYPDFSPTFASEKLAEHQGLTVNSQTLRERIILESWNSLMAHTIYGLKKDYLMNMEIQRKYVSWLPLMMLQVKSLMLNLTLM